MTKSISFSSIETMADARGLVNKGNQNVSEQNRLHLIGNRILARYYEAADTVFMDGSTPWEVDEAIVEFGFTIGPYEWQDQIGVDVAFASRQHYLAHRNPKRRQLPLLNRMMELGKLGRKTGAGWYRYPGGGGKVEDPIVADLAIEECHFEGRPRTDYSMIEIQERLLMAMINEACDALQEGIAKTAGDIDRASVQICKFPSSKGGLMQYADTWAIASIVSKLTALGEEDAIAWRISPFLQRCFENGSKLSQARII